MSFVPTMSLCLKTRWVAKSLKKENSGEIKSFSNIFKRFGSSREKDLFQFICSSTQKSFTEQRNLYKKQGFFQKLFINNRVLFFFFLKMGISPLKVETYRKNSLGYAQVCWHLC